VVRIRALSPDCEIDAGGLRVHWLTEVNPAESVALLRGFADRRERAGDGAMTAIAIHSGDAAEAALRHYLDPAQPSIIRTRATGLLGSFRRPDSRDMLAQLARSDADVQVRRRAQSALGNLPNGEGVPTLIELAKETRDADTRKHAMSLLGSSRDMRAVAFFEEVLKK
ncbi:MAG: HEAT repeat domain-containing protein, partial [Acidobacteriota bacterium]|nr:HEAT repeat domain-containing protein [Acidobacteriota bacterium]